MGGGGLFDLAKTMVSALIKTIIKNLFGHIIP